MSSKTRASRKQENGYDAPQLLLNTALVSFIEENKEGMLRVLDRTLENLNRCKAELDDPTSGTKTFNSCFRKAWDSYKEFADSIRDGAVSKLEEMSAAKAEWGSLKRDKVVRESLSVAIYRAKKLGGPAFEMDFVSLIHEMAPEIRSRGEEILKLTRFISKCEDVLWRMKNVEASRLRLL